MLVFWPDRPLSEWIWVVAKSSPPGRA